MVTSTFLERLWGYMAVCPNCGHEHFIYDPEIELELFIKVNQKRFGKFNIKKDICKEFGVRKFTDLPKELYPAALKFAQTHVEYLTTSWAVNNLVDEAVYLMLVNRLGYYDEGIANGLKFRLRKVLHLGTSHTKDSPWTKMSLNKMVDLFEKTIGNQDMLKFSC